MRSHDFKLRHYLVEAIVAMPTDIFYNTGIQTYVWLLTNRKAAERRGKVQLIDASGERFWRAMRKSLGSKRREIPDAARAEIVRIYHDTLNGNAGYGEVSKIFRTTEFGYREIRVERPLRLKFDITGPKVAAIGEDRALARLPAADLEDLRDMFRDELMGQVFTDRTLFEGALNAVLRARDVRLATPVRKALLQHFGERDDAAEICRDTKGNPEPDADLRDHELVPLGKDWRDYMAREVTPFVPDAWVDTSYRDEKDGEVGRVGYEINFNRYFYKYVPPRPLEQIDAELKTLEREIAGLLAEVVR